MLAGAVMLAAAAGVAAGQTPSFNFVGMAPGAYRSILTGLSADGRVAAGYSEVEGGRLIGFMWDSTTGRFDYGLQPGLPSSTAPRAINADGSIVVGTGGDASRSNAFRYSRADGYRELPTVAGFVRPSARGVSGDGSVVAGAVADQIGFGRATYWVGNSARYVGLASPSHFGARFDGVSGDGRTFFGVSGGGGPQEGYTWTEAGGWNQLPVPAGVGGSYACNPQAVSPDGSVVVGSVNSEAVIWSEGRVEVLAAVFPGWFAGANDFASIPGIAVGNSFDNADSGQIGTVWLPDRRPVLLTDYLRSNGVSLPDGYLFASGRVSEDGLTFAGTARSLDGLQQIAYVATIPTPGAAMVLGMGGVLALRRRRGSSRTAAARAGAGQRSVAARVLAGAAVVAAAGVAVGQTPSFTLLGFPSPNTQSRGSALSADGQTVVGYSQGLGFRSFIWTRATGRVDLPFDPPDNQATAVSGDGRVVVGFSLTQDAARDGRAFRYENGSLQTLLPPSGYRASVLNAASADGRVLAGVLGEAVFGISVASRWQQSGGWQILGVPDPTRHIASFANGISGDGRTVVGSGRGGGADQAAAWTEGSGWRSLPVPEGVGATRGAAARATNFDGSIIVGVVTPETSRSRAAVWRSGVAQLLPTLGSDWEMFANEVSEDGSIIAGTSYFRTGVAHATVWPTPDRVMLLSDHFAENGIVLPANTALETVDGLSADGRTFAGTALVNNRRQAFVATVPTPGAVMVLGMGGVLALRRRRGVALRCPGPFLSNGN